MAKSSALVDDMFIAWWIVLVTISWPLWIYETKVVILFLTVTSDMIDMVFWLIEEFS